MKALIETAGQKRSERISVLILLLLVFIILIGKSQLLVSMPINQDEFNYLNQVYDFARNTLSTPWQSIHVHFFQWLPMVSSNEVDQVMAARIVMFVCFIGTIIFLYLLARYFLSKVGSLFSVLCYISLASTIIDGANFRADTPAIFLIMISLWLFVTRRNSDISNIISGLSMALAALFTIKSAIYLVLFAALFLPRLRSLRNKHRGLVGIKPSVWFASALVGGFFLFHYLHGSTLASFDASQQGKFITSSYSIFIDLSRFFPGFQYFQLALRNNPLIWLLLACGLVIHIMDLFEQKDSRGTCPSYLLVFMLPLLSLLVYRNTFPYFYVFIMPCAMIFCGYTADRLQSFSMGLHPTVIPVLLGFLVVAISFNGILRIIYYHTYGPAFTTRQQELLTVIHRIFPQPVAYLDGCRMVSSFPNAGFFMSSAWMRGYLHRDAPALKEQILSRRPLFLLANVPHLDAGSIVPPVSAAGLALRRDDWEALRSNYIHHWGPIWLIGKNLSLKNGNHRHNFEIVAEGLYTVESEADVLLDGRLFHNGMVVELCRGKHTVEAQASSTKVTLRWGEHLYRPKSEPSWREVFAGSLM